MKKLLVLVSLLSFTALYSQVAKKVGMFSKRARACANQASLNSPEEISKFIRVETIGTKNRYRNAHPEVLSKHLKAKENEIKERAKQQQQRLEKNKCTQEEIKAGQKFDQFKFTAIHIGAGVGATLAATAAGGAAIGAALHASEKKIKTKYGENWQNKCAEIVKDKTMPPSYQYDCELILQGKAQREARREARQVEIIKSQNKKLREGRAQWSGTNPLAE